MLPTHKTKYSAGADVTSEHFYTLEPNKVVIVETGVIVPNSFPRDHFWQLCVRSSLAAKGVILANGVGVVDADYPGTIKALLINTTSEVIQISPGERIGQLVAIPFTQVFEVDDVERIGGFGSTGK